MASSIADRVNGARLWQRLMELATHGALEHGGVCRLALSQEEIAARALIADWGRSIGLEPFTDAVANLFLRLEGRDPTLAPVVIGSHIDTQPTGGKFDGAYGFLAALEAVEAIRETGRTPLRPIEVVAWTNEEGARFAPGLTGSAVFTGLRGLEDVRGIEDRTGRTLGEALDAVLAADIGIPQRDTQRPVAAFLEAHIEQGPDLERAGIPIGVVTGIQGKRTFRVQVIGEDAHAGASRRAERRDALVSAIDIVHALQRATWDEADEVRFTVGMFNVSPNAPSVVPGSVLFSVDLRHNDLDTILRLGDLVAGTCEAARGRCGVVVREMLYDPPLHFPEAIRRRIGDTAGRLGLPHMEMPSPAGHDARYLHSVCPTGMIFIPCKDGISHNEAESIEPSHAGMGARLLAETAFELADEKAPET